MTTMAVVLAAGSGSRFDAAVHKLRAPLGGQPLLCHVLETVGSVDFDERLVVWGSEPIEDLVEGDDFTLLYNEHHADGQATSLAVAVDHARTRGHDTIVVGLADQPFIDAATWRSVRDAEGVIVTASFGGRHRPPVKLSSSVFSELPLTGDEGARVLMRSRPELVTEVTCESDPADIDTSEDLDRWK